jgi:hypothetical protein
MGNPAATVALVGTATIVVIGESMYFLQAVADIILVVPKIG